MCSFYFLSPPTHHSLFQSLVATLSQIKASTSLWESVSLLGSFRSPLPPHVYCGRPLTYALPCFDCDVYIVVSQANDPKVKTNPLSQGLIHLSLTKASTRRKWLG